METKQRPRATRTIRELSDIFAAQLRARRRALRWLVAILSLALVARYLVRHQDELSFVMDLDWHTMLLVVATTLAYIGVRAWRDYVILMHNRLENLAFAGWFWIFIVARFLNKWVPQSGNVYRGVRLKAGHGFSYTKYATSYASSAWLGAILDLALALGVTVILEPTLRIGPWPASAATGVALVLVLGGPVVLQVALSGIRVPGTFLAPIHRVLWEVVSKSVESLGDVVFVSRVSLLGVIGFFLTALQLRLTLQAFQIDASVPTVAVFVSLRRLSLALNLTPGNLGVQELAYGFLGSALGVGATQGIVASGATRVADYAVLTTLVGSYAALRLFNPRAREEH